MTLRQSSMAKWIIPLGLLAVASAWTISCQGEDKPSATTALVTPTPAVTTSSAVDISTLTPIPTLTATRQPVATNHPSTPTPTRGTITDLPGNVCGPFWIPHKGDFHQHFIHWTKDGLHLVFDASEAIWIVDETGTQVKQVIDPDPARGARGDLESVYGFYADVSPDGTRIVYTTCEYSVRNANPADMRDDVDPRAKLGYEISVVNIDGTAKSRLTSNANLEHYPVWSPDGSKIAYVSSTSSFGRYDSKFSYLIVRSTEDAESASFVRRFDQASSNVALHPPVWSPDGQQIAVLIYKLGIGPPTPILYTIRTDGTELSKIGEATTLPTWSPDGSELAFAGPAPADGKASAIYAVKPDGSDRRIIWSDESDSASHGIHQVSWSPTGSDLLFISDSVYTIDSSIGVPRKVSRAYQDKYPRFRRYSAATLAAWSPDGSTIAVYHPDRELMIMARDGTDTRTLVGVTTDGTANTP